MSAREPTIAEEIVRYVRFDEADAARLRAIAPIVRPHFARVTKLFYERIAEHDGARAIFRGGGQAERLERSLLDWLERLVSGVYDRAHFERTERIGEVHVQVGLPQRYMPAAMGLVRSELVAVVLAEAAPETAPAAVRALDRLLDVELTVMVESYRRRSEERIRALASAQRTERLAAVGMLAAGLAHEIRNPLNGAHLHAAFLERELERAGARPELLDAVRTIDGELGRLSALVTEFLQFARPQPLTRRPTPLCEVVRRAESLLGPDARAQGVHLAVDLPPRPIEVVGDADKLEQVVLNLGRNAIEAFAGGPPGHVALRVRGEGDRGLIEVEDDGPGVPAPDAPIFDAFYSTKPGGTGLGLPIAHRIVTDHDGTLSVESGPGRTVFSVALPMAPSSFTELR